MKLFQSLRTQQSQHIVQAASRNFGPKAPAAKGGKPAGGPGAAPAAEIPKRGKTVLQEMVDSGTEFIMGPPPGLNKTQNAHRESMVHKLEPRIDLYARKLRELYFREGTIPVVKSFIDPIRERQSNDTIEKCHLERVVPGVISARDEYSDVDLVFPWRVPFAISRSEHSLVRPWYLKHPVTEEELRVTCNRIDYHTKTKLPYFMEFQRYIVGRPNLLRLPVIPV